MPVTTTKEKGGGYTNKTPGGVKGRGMTLRNAMAQRRLLYGVKHGWKPTGKKSRKKYAKAVEKAKTMHMKY